MNASTPNARPARSRTWILLFVLIVLAAGAGGLLWWQARPISLPALAAPPVPASPFRAENPADQPPGGLRLRSEPLITPLQFTGDPWRRKIRAFELVLGGPVSNAFAGTIFFDIRDITFNEFGDERFPTGQLAEAHPARFVEVPREELEANPRAIMLFGRNHQRALSRAKRLYAVEFAQGEHPHQFWFVHDSSPAAGHFLWVSRKSLSTEPGATRPLPPSDLGLRLFGAEVKPDGPLAQPLRLAGYRAQADFGMKQAAVEAGIILAGPGERRAQTNLVATVTLDPNKHDMDVLGEPTGMRTLIGYASIDCDMSPMDHLDPTGQERQVWRLKPAAGAKGGLWWGGGDGSPTADYHFDLVLAPASNGRHRLLIWQRDQLRNLVHLNDALARRQAALVERLQVVPGPEREAMLSLFAEDPEAEVTIGGGHIIGLSVTRLAPAAAVVRAIGGMPVLETLALHGGSLTTEIGAALAGLQHLKALTASNISFEEGVYEPLGRLSRLEELHIRGADRLTDAALEHVSRLTNLTMLVINREFHPRPDHWRDLVLSEPGIARIASLTKLTHLDLHGQNATDANCHQLATLTNLTYLAMSGERLTDAGLAALKPLTNLTFLHLSHVAITKPAAEAFKRPGLNFEPGPFGREQD